MADMNETNELSAARDAGPSAEDDLATVCRHTAELIRIAGVPLRCISVRYAQTAIKIEWQSVNPYLDIRPSSEEAGSSNGQPRPASVSDDDPDDDREYICASLVGTFYRAAQPGGKPFVEIGDHVDPGCQVAIIEAMKLMNPVEADRAGRVAEFMLPDGAAVEYGQPLIALVSATEE